MKSEADWSRADWETFIGRIPKTETHLHFEGAIPWKLLHEHDPEKFPEPPACWAPDYVFDEFLDFERQLISMAVEYVVTPERYASAARALFAEVQANGVRYLETSFHLGMVDFFPELPPERVLAAIRSAIPEGLEVRVFAGMPRTEPSPVLHDALERVLKLPGLAGIDVHGVETIPLLPWMDKYWKRARAVGLETKAHAGEYGGPESVAEVIDRLKVTRVQHGIGAARSPELVKRLAADGIVLDVCPISNVKLGRAKDLRSHPLKALLAAGVRCTVSTDDPMIFGNSLNQEYFALAMEAGFSARELLQIARNGFLAGKPSEALRKECLAEIDALEAELR